MFEVGGDVNGFGSEGGHGRLVEDGERAAEGGEIDD